MGGERQVVDVSAFVPQWAPPLVLREMSAERRSPRERAELRRLRVPRGRGRCWRRKGREPPVVPACLWARKRGRHRGPSEGHAGGDGGEGKIGIEPPRPCHGGRHWVRGLYWDHVRVEVLALVTLWAMTECKIPTQLLSVSSRHRAGLGRSRRYEASGGERGARMWA